MAFIRITLLDPLQFMLLSISFIPRTIFRILSTREISALTSWSAFQSTWFATFWSYYGPKMAETATPVVSPLLSLARGIVLDIGPGAGSWIHLYDPSTVTKIYGIEPNKGHHDALRQKIKSAGLEGTYEIIGAGAEDLRGLNLGIDEGTVDTVVTLAVLCSVPQPDRLIRDLYGYLKPGGKWIMYEHVRTHQTGFVSWYQAALDLVWGYIFNGCSITRATDEKIRRVGEWEDVKMAPPSHQREMYEYLTVPGMAGVLTKSS